MIVTCCYDWQTFGSGSERGVDICHETVRFWWNWFGPMFTADIRRRRVNRMRGFRHWRWHLDGVFVKINGERH
jgi:putative transposase